MRYLKSFPHPIFIPQDISTYLTWMTVWMIDMTFIKTMTVVVMKTYFCYVLKVVGGRDWSVSTVAVILWCHFYQTSSLSLFLHLLATFIIKRALITRGPVATARCHVPTHCQGPANFADITYRSYVPQYLQYQHCVIKVNISIELLCVYFKSQKLSIGSKNS